MKKPRTPQRRYRVKGKFVNAPVGQRAQEILEDLRRPNMSLTPQRIGYEEQFFKLQSVAMALIDMIDEGTTWQDGQRRQFLALMCPVGDVTADDIARAQKRLGIK